MHVLSILLFGTVTRLNPSKKIRTKGDAACLVASPPSFVPQTQSKKERSAQGWMRCDRLD